MKTIWTVLVAVLAVAAGILFVYSYSDKGSQTDEEEIRAMVTEFGTKLQMVSLLAPGEVLNEEMDEHYASYLSSELLMSWKSDSSLAVGRRTSSPYPHRIEIVEVVPEGNSSCRVEGNIIEVTNADDPLHGVFAVQLVTLEVEHVAGSWIIVSLEKGSYSQIPQQVTLTGYWECLPHKEGIATKECRTGLAIDQSDGHVALDLSVAAMQMGDIRNGDKVTVTGILVPSNQLSSDVWQSYSIDGVLAVTSFEKISDEASGARGMSIEQYVSQNIAELSPRDPELGGTFYVTQISAENGQGVVHYEDGHIALIADFTYAIEPEHGGITITSFLVREE